jgi:DNA repair protein RadC
MEKKYSGFIPITSWAEADRPREKLMAQGRTALTDAELIAILLGTGTREKSAVDIAKLVLDSVNNNLNELGKKTVPELQKINGIGEAKAITIVAALELGRRRKESEIPRKVKITCSRDAYDDVKKHFEDLPFEEFRILLLNRSNHVMKTERISTGGVSGTVADPKIIFNKALEALASSIILCHNHPSGNLNPSEADIQLTKKLKEAGKFLEIPVLDHLICTDSGYYSFADEGIL